MYQENWTQARHHENQRSELAKALIGVAGAAIAIISLKTGLVLKDLPLTVFVFLLGGFGAVFSAKQYERVRFHLERAAAHCEELNELLPGSPLGALEDRVDEHHNHIFPWLGALRLNLFWTGLYVCIAAIGLGLSAVAIFWPSEYLAQPRSTVPPFDLRR
jgi:hypothetical protein